MTTEIDRIIQKEKRTAVFYILFGAYELLLTSPMVLLALSLVGLLAAATILWAASVVYALHLAFYFWRRAEVRASVRLLAILPFAHLSFGIAYPGSLPHSAFLLGAPPLRSVEFFCLLGWMGTAMAIVALGFFVSLSQVTVGERTLVSPMYLAAKRELAEIGRRNPRGVDVNSEDGKRAAILMQQMREQSPNPRV